ncbi:MAG TPA: NlpC/P60 family protein [Gryllotalpicola sp.]
MSVVDAVARVQQIQSELGSLQSGATSGASGGDAFAKLLNAAQGAVKGTVKDASAAQPAATAPAATTSPDAPGPDGTGQTAGSAVTGGQIVADAERYLGVPYVFGGESTSGMDCSGLVQKVLGDLGISAPRVVQDQAKIGTAVPSLAQAQPGDLIVEKGNGHIQIYAGDGMIIEAPKPGENVVKRKEWLSSDQIGTIRRVATAAPSAADPAAVQPAAAQPSAADSSAAAMTAVLAQLLAGASAQAGAGGDDDTDASAALAALTGSTAASATAGSAAALTQFAVALTPQATTFSAPQIAAPTPATAPYAPALAGQLSGPIVQLVQQPGGGHTVVVRVVPEQLGPVTVDARTTEHGLHIELSTPSDAGRDALNGILGDLRRDLAAGGITASVSLGSAAAGQGGAQGGQQNAQQALFELFEQNATTQASALAPAPLTTESPVRRAGVASDSVLDILA